MDPAAPLRENPPKLVARALGSCVPVGTLSIARLRLGILCRLSDVDILASCWWFHPRVARVGLIEVGNYMSFPVHWCDVVWIGCRLLSRLCRFLEWGLGCWLVAMFCVVVLRKLVQRVQSLVGALLVFFHELYVFVVFEMLTERACGMCQLKACIIRSKTDISSG